MSYGTRRVFVSISFVFVFAWTVSGCSGSGGSEAVGTLGEDGRVAIGIEVASGFVTVQNNAGRPLVDMQIAIKPARSVPYTVNIPRVGAGDKKGRIDRNLRGTKRGANQSEDRASARDRCHRARC